MSEVTGSDDGDGEIFVVEAGAGGDMRTFPEKVYDMVSAESGKGHGLILWEDSGKIFSVARDSDRLPSILEKHFGGTERDPSAFEARLIKYGWERETSTFNSHVGYRNAKFFRGMERLRLKEIKRKRRSSAHLQGSTATATFASQSGVNVGAGATTSRLQNPQDGSFETTGTSGETNVARRRGPAISEPIDNSSALEHQQRVETRSPRLAAEPVGPGEGDVTERNARNNQREAENNNGANPALSDEQEVISIDDDDSNSEHDSDCEVLMVLPALSRPSEQAAAPSPAQSSRSAKPTTGNSTSSTSSRTEGAVKDSSIASSRTHAAQDLHSQSAVDVARSHHAETTSKSSSSSVAAPCIAPPMPGKETNSAPQETPQRRGVSPNGGAKSSNLAKTAAHAKKAPPSAREQNLVRVIASAPSSYSPSGHNDPTIPIGSAKEAESMASRSNKDTEYTPRTGANESSAGCSPVPIAFAMANESPHRKPPASFTALASSLPDSTIRNSPSFLMSKLTRDSVWQPTDIEKPADDSGLTIARNMPSKVNGTCINQLQRSVPRNADAPGMSNWVIAAASGAGLPSSEDMKPEIDISGIGDGDLLQMVKQAWKEVQIQSACKAESVLKNALKVKRNKIIRAASNRQKRPEIKQRTFGERLIATKQCTRTWGEPKTKRNTNFSASQGGRESRVISYRLDGTARQQPRHNSPIMTSQLQYIQEEEEIRFVPYFQEEHAKLGKILDENFNTEERKKRMQRGAIYQEENMNLDLDCLLEQLGRKFCGRKPTGMFVECSLQAFRKRIAERVQEVTQINATWLSERFDVLQRKGRVDDVKTPDKIYCQEDRIWSRYLEQIDTYRALFCSRCFTYNCSFHGNGEAKKPCLDLQYEKGVYRVEDGYWRGVDLTPSVDVKQSRKNNSVDSKRLSKPQEALCERLFLIYSGDYSKIAAVFGVPTHVISGFFGGRSVQLPERRLIQKQPQAKGRYTSMKNYEQSWMKKVENTRLLPWCVPCSHTEPCSETSCRCVQSAHWCTKSCARSEYSKYFFRGCECQGDCSKSHCACYKANRECDPDLCKACGACTDPPNTYERVNQKCRNDNISMRRHRRLLVAESTIPNAGWGLFTKEPLKKGDFIQEYLGELVTEEEGNRRGYLYDQLDSNYLFTQSTDYQIDAMVKGNKARFGNFSAEPNVEVKKLFVNGNARIGFFANQDIQAQSELFVNYGESFMGKFMKEQKKK